MSAKQAGHGLLMPFVYSFLCVPVHSCVPSLLPLLVHSFTEQFASWSLAWILKLICLGSNPGSANDKLFVRSKLLDSSVPPFSICGMETTYLPWGWVSCPMC